MKWPLLLLPVSVSLSIAACGSTELDARPPAESNAAKTTYEYAASPISAAVDGRRISIENFNFSSSAKIDDAPIVEVGDGCEREHSFDIEGVVAIAERGSCSFEQKYRNMRSAKVAALIILAQDAPGGRPGQWAINPRVSLTDIPVFAATDPESIGMLNSGQRMSIDFDGRVDES